MNAVAAAETSRHWRGQRAWRILDTGFADGGLFLALWQAWATDPQRSGLLHYVAVTPHPPGRDALLARMSSFSALAPYREEFARTWFGLLPGFHRMVLHGGRVLLTVCVGPLQAMLRQQQFVADWIVAPAADRAIWDRWCVKALVRLCRRGTGLDLVSATALLRSTLTQAGFVLHDDGPSAPLVSGEVLGALRGRFEPQWEPASTRDRWRQAPRLPTSCVIVGAGLAGAAAAAALAQRGWQVQVLDAEDKPAAGASSLPIGLMAPLVSRDDNPRSQLSRAGVRATLERCWSELDAGADWLQSGMLEWRPVDKPGLPPDWPAAGHEWSNHALPREPSEPGDHHASSIWHPSGAWIKPERLVRALLARPAVRFDGRSKVQSIAHRAGQWQLYDAHGGLLAQAPLLIVAAAGDSVRLLGEATRAIGIRSAVPDPLLPMDAIGGRVSWGLQASADAHLMPLFPLNGDGSYVAHIPCQGEHAWFAGATYETPGSEAATAPARHAHAANLERLARLAPEVAHVLSDRFAAGAVNIWSGVRCATIDRLPAVGPLDEGALPMLWAATGMGSRGLTYAVLCGEMLAAQLCGEPLPVEARLANNLALGRPNLRRSARSG